MNAKRNISIVAAAIALGCGSMLAIFWPRGTIVIETKPIEVHASQPFEGSDPVQPRACDALNGITTSCVYG